MKPAREIAVANRYPRLRLDRRAVARAVHTLDAHHASLATRHSTLERSPSGELSLVFLTDAALAKLHADFLADPTPTDVITFEGDPALHSAGEICVSVDAALRHVSTCRPAPLAFSTELTLYLIHGWLHLAGHDDRQPAHKKRMRAAEARALALLRARRTIPKFAIGG